MTTAFRAGRFAGRIRNKPSTLFIDAGCKILRLLYPAAQPVVQKKEMTLNPYAKHLGKKDPLKVLAATPARISALIRGLSPRQLSRRPKPDKWSIREIINHLTETEMVLCCRARWIAFEDKPTLVPFDQEKWATGWAREKEPVAETLERLRLIRKSHVRLFKNVPKADLKRTGCHPERGIVSLTEQMETAAGHDLNHLEQIQRLAGSREKGS